MHTRNWKPALDGKGPGGASLNGVVVGYAGKARPMCLLRIFVESRDTGKSRMSGSGSEMWETASGRKRKAGRSPYAPTLDFHTRAAAAFERFRYSSLASLTESGHANEWILRHALQFERHRLQLNGSSPGSGERSRHVGCNSVERSCHARTQRLEGNDELGKGSRLRQRPASWSHGSLRGRR